MLPETRGKKASKVKGISKAAIERRSRGRGLKLGHDKTQLPKKNPNHKVPDFSGPIERKRNKSTSTAPWLEGRQVEKTDEPSRLKPDFATKVRLLSGARNTSSIK